MQAIRRFIGTARRGLVIGLIGRTATTALRLTLVHFPELRLSAAAGMPWFFAFSTIWVGLAISLALPPWSFSADAIGFYSLVGLLGLFVTPMAGRFADRYGARRVKLVGLTAAAASTLVLLSTLGQPFVSAPALAVFDAVALPRRSRTRPPSSGSIPPAQED